MDQKGTLSPTVAKRPSVSKVVSFVANPVSLEIKAPSVSKASPKIKARWSSSRRWV